MVIPVYMESETVVDAGETPYEYSHVRHKFRIEAGSIPITNQVEIRGGIRSCPELATKWSSSFSVFEASSQSLPNLLGSVTEKRPSGGFLATFRRTQKCSPCLLSVAMNAVVKVARIQIWFCTAGGLAELRADRPRLSHPTRKATPPKGVTAPHLVTPVSVKT